MIDERCIMTLAWMVMDLRASHEGAFPIVFGADQFQRSH